jgi:HPt (histidine-containing phosphotransfer) domain-containing protein
MAIETINETELLEHLEGDEELLLELIDSFLTESDPILRDVLSALGGRDADALYRAAHKLKGMVSIFGSGETTQSALTLEMMGRERNLDKADAAAAMLQEKMAELRSSLTALKEKHV